MSEINAVFGSSYTAVAYMTGDVLFFYICVCLRNMVSNTSLSLILSVSLEFTSLQFLMGSVLLVYFVVS